MNFIDEICLLFGYSHLKRQSHATRAFDKRVKACIGDVIT